jgi:hypothetical protein
MSVSEDDFITMAHFGQSFKKFGANRGMDSFKHKLRFVGKGATREALINDDPTAIADYVAARNWLQ